MESQPFKMKERKIKYRSKINRKPFKPLDSRVSNSREPTLQDERKTDKMKKDNKPKALQAFRLKGFTL